MSSDEQQEVSGATEQEPTICVCPGEVDPPKRQLTPEVAEQARKDSQEVFDYLDVDKSGYIDVSEVENLLRQWNDVEGGIFEYTEEEIKNYGVEFMRQFDANTDSKVTFDEIYNAALRDRGYDV